MGNCGTTTPPTTCEDQPDPHDCDYYISNCKERIKCPEGQHFNRVTKRCENQCTAGCQIASDMSDCVSCEREGKTFEDPCSCEMYYKCLGGVRVLVMCDDGLHYDKQLGRCEATCSDTCPKLFALSPNAVLQQKGNPSLYVLQLLIGCFYLIRVTVVGFINVYKAYFIATGVHPDINGILIKTRVINLVSVREGL